MRLGFLWLLAIGVVVLSAGAASAQAQSAALTGRVSSADEPAMEGVLVSAKKAGSAVTITVVSNEQGRYAFPTDRLDPGNYTISIRAIGYRLDGPKTAEVAAGAAATADLKLSKIKNLTAQLSSGEWLVSMPGEAKQKAFLTQCVGCHTLQRVLTSTHSPAEFEQVFLRMSRYSPGSTPTHPQPLLPGPRGERPAVIGDAAKAAAEYLASLSRGNAEATEFELKGLPRPKGRATRVIVTEYDLPRKEAMPHDVIVDADGKAWYSDFGNQFVGVLDPKTGAVKDIPIPVLKPEQPKGGLDLEFDPQGNVWLSMMYQAGVSKIDRKTHEVKAYPFPKEWQSASTQASMVSPQHSDVDGKVWSNNQEDHYGYRLDVATGQWENFGQAKDPAGRQIRAYGMPADRNNNVYQLGFSSTHIGLRKVNEGGLVRIWATPTELSRPRRGRVDEQNRLWFAEYGANGIGMFDPKTEVIKEWKLPTPWSAPYDVVFTKREEAWTGSMLNDQVARLDTKTGEVVEYLLPRTTNIRVFVDDSGPRPAFWAGSNHGASIVKLEPLD
jgi:streptogramin lyase